MNEQSGSLSPEFLPPVASTECLSQHTVVVARPPDRNIDSHFDAASLSAIPVDFLVAVAVEASRKNSDARCEAAAHAAKSIAASGSSTDFLQSFSNSPDCCWVLRAVAAQRIRLVTMCLNLPVWGQCRDSHIKEVLDDLAMSSLGLDYK